MKKYIVSLSGGVDSTVLFSSIIQSSNPEEVLAVIFKYGSKHNMYENEAAVKIADYFGVEKQVIDLTDLFDNIGGSNLLASGGEIPEGHYEEDSMMQTVVPGRNIIFASVLGALAMSRKILRIYIGIHAGDHHIYPDCRPEFYHNMERAIRFGTDEKVLFLAPFLHDTKAYIIRYGLMCKTPFHLTRTCYKDQPIACGKCGSYQERLEAFHLNGINDPIEYESRELMPKKG